MRIDRVDPKRDEREREDGRQQRPGPVPAQQPSHDPVRDGGGEAAENRRVRDLDDVVRTERLDERRLGKELERRQDQRELRVGNFAEGDPQAGIEIMTEQEGARREGVVHGSNRPLAWLPSVAGNDELIITPRPPRSVPRRFGAKARSRPRPVQVSGEVSPMRAHAPPSCHKISS